MDPELVFVDFVVKHMVDHPGDVRIEKKVDENGVLLELTVNKVDVGRVIGKQGATAQSLRTLLRALGTRNNSKYNLKIMEPQEE